MTDIKIYSDPDVILREIADEFLLIPVGEAGIRIRGMISLTESGALLWKCLSEPKTTAELVDVILSEYDIDRETAAGDVNGFAEKMKKIGIIHSAA